MKRTMGDTEVHWLEGTTELTECQALCFGLRTQPSVTRLPA